MSDTKKVTYAGMLPGTKEFRMKSLTPEEKKISIDRVNALLDNIDDIQGLIGLEEYIKHLSHWQAVISAIENEY